MKGLFTRKDFPPLDFSGTAICSKYRFIKYMARSFPNLRSSSISLNEGNNGKIGHNQRAILSVPNSPPFVCHGSPQA
jgi:hypothetical protein